MSDIRTRRIAAAALVSGAVLGVAGTFVSSAAVRGIAWGLDGFALIVGSALLTVHHLKEGNEQLAAAFLVFVAGEALIVSGSAMDLQAAAPSFAAGAGLWSAALALIGVSSKLPLFVRAPAALACVLFAVFALQVLGGGTLTALSRPLPFFAYPFLALTLVELAWNHVKSD